MMGTVMTWVGPTLNVAALVLLAAVLWRLGREPVAAWSEREARLQLIFDDLRTLVAQSEGLARDLDGKLAGREERLRALLAEAETITGGRSTAAGVMPAATLAQSMRRVGRAAAVEAWSTATAGGRVPSTEGELAAVATRIATLADTGISVDEIARRLGVATAEVRLVIGLNTARAARPRVPLSAEAQPHA